MQCTVGYSRGIRRVHVLEIVSESIHKDEEMGSCEHESQTQERAEFKLQEKRMDVSSRQLLVAERTLPFVKGSLFLTLSPHTHFEELSHALATEDVTAGRAEGMKRRLQADRTVVATSTHHPTYGTLQRRLLFLLLLVVLRDIHNLVL